MQNNTTMRVLGIDPGFERLGIAVVEKTGTKEILLYSECFKTSSKETFTDRLFAIGKHVAQIIEQYQPNILSIEKLYFNTNQKTAMQVAETRGVILYEAMLANLRIAEFTPLEVKVAVTSYGRSDKTQVQEMVSRLIDIKNTVTSDDEFDAVALALTCLAHNRQN